MLILKKPFDDLWKGKDAFEEVEKISGEVYRSVATRETLRFEVRGKGYYLKLHHGITYKEFFKNVFSFHAPVLGARNEWRAINRLAQLGVDTMKGVAYGERGLNPIKQTSFIVTEDLAPCISLEDFCEKWATEPPAYSVKKPWSHAWRRWFARCTKPVSITEIAIFVTFYFSFRLTI